MFNQHSDTNRNIVHFVCDEKVTQTDLAGHRRGAILAARDVGRPFVVATDLTGCTAISTTAAETLAETVCQLSPFGLSRELRIVSGDTPSHVLDAFGTPGQEHIEVLTVPSQEALGPALDAHLDSARC